MRTLIQKVCELCSKSYEVGLEQKQQRFCGRKCAGLAIRGGNHPGKKRIRRIAKRCAFCGKDFSVPCRKKHNVYCSRNCYTQKQKTIVGDKNWNYGRRRTEEQIRRIMENRHKVAHLAGKDNPQWKGGRTRDKRGYILIHVSSLTPEEMVWFPSRRHPYVPEHRLVVCRKLMRALIPSEHVHHINGVKDDNRPENLFALDHAAHTREHALIWRRLQRLEDDNRSLKEQVAKLQAEVIISHGD